MKLYYMAQRRAEILAHARTLHGRARQVYLRLADSYNRAILAEIAKGF